MNYRRAAQRARRRLSSLLDTPLTIFSPAERGIWLFADAGPVVSSGTVGTWRDLFGANDAVQATAGKQPAFTGTDATLNNHSSVAFDGVDDQMVSSWVRPTPSTGPSYVSAIIKQVTWTNNDVLIGDTKLDAFLLQQHGTTPQVRSFNSNLFSPLNDALVVGQWFRVEMQYTATAADYLKIGTEVVNGINTGDSPGLGLQLGCTDTPGQAFGRVTVAQIVGVLGVVSDAKRARLDAYYASLYQGSVGL